MINMIQESNPSVTASLPELFADAYTQARAQVINDTGLDEALLPQECPFDYDHLMLFNLDESRMANRI